MGEKLTEWPETKAQKKLLMARFEKQLFQNIESSYVWHKFNIHLPTEIFHFLLK